MAKESAPAKNGKPDLSPDVRRLLRRLSVHKRRMRYWAVLPGAYGPVGRSLDRAAEKYELACYDALNIAEDIERMTGQRCLVEDVRRTFRARLSNPNQPPIFLNP
jgi:hypothetical protein